MPSSIISGQNVTLYDLCLITLSKIKAKFVWATNLKLQVQF